ncbi:DNA polymerase III subunit epsilon-like [Phymastichus coffea]|uniref:DNA polymerase III subunit epsilon-like n=1 Tax=Phymastichus coffea TaxID=108790 RepID=UPI00273BC157|nr:DNA polymerase III subunit epsilon-like [Phymastichus coffea]
MEIDMPEKSNADAKSLLVYFDLETTGLDTNAQIVQIAAKCGRYEYSVYVNPTKEISKSATKVTGLSNSGGMLCLNGKAVESVDLQEALIAFKQFLESLSKSKKYLLVAHNATFDIRVFLNSLVSCNMLRDFEVVVGFSDSLKAFKKLIIEKKKGPGQFTLKGLATKYLEPKDLENFHDATGDVRVLEKLVKYFTCQELLNSLQKSYYDCCNKVHENNKINFKLQYLRELKGVLSLTYLKKLAKYNITYQQLLELYKKEGADGIHKLFTEKSEGKVKITKDIKVLNTLVHFFQTDL